MADLDDDEEESAPEPSQALALGGGKGAFQFLPGVVSPSALPTAPDLQPAQDIQSPSLGQEAGAFGLGLGRGATFGGTDILAAKTGLLDPKTIEHLKQIAPGWSGAGQFLGSTATMAGLTALTAGADLPVLGAGIAARVGIQGAIGAAAGAGQAISEDALGEAPLTAERVLGHVGLDALIGAGTQGLFEGLGAAIPKAFERFRAATVDADGALHNVAAAGAGNAVGGAVPDNYGPMDFLRNAAVATDPAELAREIEYSTKGAKAAVQATKEQALGSLGKALSKVVDGQDEAHDQFQMQHVNQMRNNIPSDDQTTNGAVQSTADLISGLRGRVADMRADPDTFSDKALINQYETQINRYEKAVNQIDPRSPTAAGDLFSALHDFRRNADDKLPFDKLRAQAADQPLTGGRVAGEILGLRHITSDALGNEGTWGQAAKFYNETNAVQSARMDAESNMEKTGVFQLLGSQMPDGSWRPNLNKINTYLNKYAQGKADSDLPMQSIQNWVTKLKAENDYMQGRFKLGGMEPIDDMTPQINALEEAQRTAKTATDAAINFVKPPPGIAQQFARYAKGGKGSAEEGGVLEAGAAGLEAVNRGSESAESHMGEAAAGMLGAAGLGHVAALGLGAIGGIKMIRGVIPTTIRALGWLARRNAAASLAVRTAAEDAVEGKAAGASIRAISDQAPSSLAGVDLGGGPAPTGSNAAAHVANQIHVAASDPAGFADRMAAATNSIAPHAPGITAQMARIGSTAMLFLAAKMPSDPFAGQTVVPSDWKPTPSQAREAESYVLGTLYPFRTIQRVNEGTATPQEVEALNAVYPALAADHKGAISARLIKHPEKLQDMTHQHKTRLTAYLGRPVDRTNLPMTAQPATMPAAAPQPTSRAKPLRSTLSIANRSRLSTDRGD